MSATPAVCWRWTSEPLSERLIRNAERALGVDFPADYRACVRDNHGGAPEPADFRVDLGAGRHLAGSVGLLLSLDPRQDENVLATIQDLTADGHLPPGLIPILNDGTGRFLCLDYRADPSNKAPTIAYVTTDPEAVTVAHDFTAFLGLLGTAPDGP